MTRREKFRAYMGRMAAAASPALAIEQRLYVHPPAAISDLIVARFEIDPSSRHLIVGGIGSGKSTQLFMVRDRLNALGDLNAEYVDVSEKQDLTQIRPGCLVALAGLTIHERIYVTLYEEVPEWGNFLRWTGGPWGFLETMNSKQRHGIVRPPQHDWPDIPHDKVEMLRRAHEVYAREGQTFVLLIDSLDRMTNREDFSRVVEQDIAALRKAGIGVVLIGPIRSLTSFGRLDADRFDYLHVQSPIDIINDDEGRRFLLEVLQRRSGPGMLPEEASRRLVQLSGGVLRDLISLARAAGDEAYLRGADSIGLFDVETAANNFGRALMVGLSHDDIGTLKHLRATGGFVRTSEDDLALMATRRILEYRTPVRYAVHPTIEPLLDQVVDRT